MASSPKFIEIPVNELTVSLEDFQGRSEEYSSVTYGRIVKEVRDGTFNFSALPAIMVWKDIRTGKWVILAGHSRTAAFRDLSNGKHPINPAYKKSDFAKIHAQVFVADDYNSALEQAKKVAQESNLSGQQSNIDFAYKVVKPLRESSKNMSRYWEKMEDLFGANKMAVHKLSFLNPDGKTVAMLRATKDLSDRQQKATVETIAEYIGKARERMPQLTDQHETELYNWLVKVFANPDEVAKKKIGSESKFLDLVGSRIIRLGWEPEQPLNLDLVGAKSIYEQTYDQIKEEKEEQIKVLQKEYNAKKEALIKLDWPIEKIEEKLDAQEKYIIRLQKELAKYIQSYSQVEVAAKNELNLFDAPPPPATPPPPPAETKYEEKLSKLLAMLRLSPPSHSPANPSPPALKSTKDETAKIRKFFDEVHKSGMFFSEYGRKQKGMVAVAKKLYTNKQIEFPSFQEAYAWADSQANTKILDSYSQIENKSPDNLQIAYGVFKKAFEIYDKVLQDKNLVDENYDLMGEEMVKQGIVTPIQAEWLKQNIQYMGEGYTESLGRWIAYSQFYKLENEWEKLYAEANKKFAGIQFVSQLLTKLGFVKLSDKENERFNGNGVTIGISGHRLIQRNKGTTENPQWGFVELYIPDGQNAFSITELMTDGSSRGTGASSSVLNSIIEFADEKGATIYVQPNVALAKKFKIHDGLTREQLIAFYEKRGFERVSPAVWVRKPKVVQKEAELKPIEKVSEKYAKDLLEQFENGKFLVQQLDYWLSEFEARADENKYRKYEYNGREYDPHIIREETGYRDVDMLKQVCETAIHIFANSIIESSGSQLESYERLCNFYKIQPRIIWRSTKSVQLQQYSTPIPIAYLMSRFCITPGKPGSFFEPTAGTGLLTIGTNPKMWTVNEIDPDRLFCLKVLGFEKTTSQDAMFLFPYGRDFDAVIANPPFQEHPTVNFEGYKLKRKEFIIAANALRCMKENGRAAIIIGGAMKYDEQDLITPFYTDGVFFNYLYRYYNVVDVISLSPDFYVQMGALTKIRIILIDGLGDAEPKSPPKKDMEIPVYLPNSPFEVKDFASLYERVSASMSE